jgi:hypothetical protein
MITYLGAAYTSGPSMKKRVRLACLITSLINLDDHLFGKDSHLVIDLLVAGSGLLTWNTPYHHLS